MSSRKRGKRKDMPAVNTIKVDDQVLVWLQALREALDDSFSGVIREAITNRYPNIEELAEEFQKQQVKRQSEKKKLSELISKTPSPDED